ncbi:DUF4446 family protein [Candidatus Woesebacteria bacterium]|nr:DUF4446 family protein [Candidatus Woesebacteria bacterium]
MEAQYIILIIFGVWLLVITGLWLKLFLTFRKLTKDIKDGDLVKILKKILNTGKENKKEIKELFKEIERVDEENRINLQKIGLVRFNPFRELGGDHSFCLTLLDKNDNGFIITGLHTRERTRVYLKDIQKGRSAVKLSKEEEKSLKKAINS